MIIERREFLKLFGGATGMLVVGGLGLNQVMDVPEEILEKARLGPGLESWKNTICGMCPGGCGIQVRLIDDVPVYLRGNANFPVNFGGMCPLGHAALETLFNPDRIHHPLKRIGPPGIGRFEAADWSGAIDEISARLTALREDGRPHEVAFLGTPDGTLTEEVVRRFMRAYGSPNVFLNPELKQSGVPYLLTEGTTELPAFDLLNARTVVSLGANFLEEGHAPIHYTKLYSRGAGDTRRRLIQVEPRAGLTGAKADRWIRIRPGTYAALALGIAHVLIREELFDSDFVREHTFGFEDWTDAAGVRQRGFRTMVLEDYFPQRASEITGVPSATILDIARELGIETPSVVIGGSGVAKATNGTFGMMAVHSLNALLGNFGVDGGIYRAGTTPLSELPPVELDDVAETGLAHASIGAVDGFPMTGFSIDAFTKNLLSGRPYPLEVLFLLGGNPVFESISHHEFVEALGRIPLVVSFDSFMSETSEYADLILPDHTFLEKWDVVSRVPTVGAAHVGIRRPVIDPAFDTRHAADVVRELARSIGSPVATAAAFDNQQAAVRHQVRGLYDAGYGAVASEGVRDSWLEYLRQRGWHLGQYDSFDSFWRELLRHGGWWNPVRDRSTATRFQTPSGRFEFFSQALMAVLAGDPQGSASEETVAGRIAELGLSAQGAVAVMPHHEPDQESNDSSLHLVVFETLSSRGGNGANLPLMQEHFGMAAHQPWSTWVEINPSTAESLGISDGDWIRLDSSIGTLRAQARIVPAVSPDVVAMPFGQGHTSYGRYARDVGVNPHKIIRSRYDPVSGLPGVLSTRVVLSTSV